MRIGQKIWNEIEKEIEVLDPTKGYYKPHKVVCPYIYYMSDNEFRTTFLRGKDKYVMSENKMIELLMANQNSHEKGLDAARVCMIEINTIVKELIKENQEMRKRLQILAQYK